MMPGKTNSAAGDDGAGPAMHQPADINRQLVRLGARQQHAIAQRMQEALLADPFLLVDDDAMHDRDLPGRAAERQRRNAQPDAKRFGKRHAVAMCVCMRRRLRECGFRHKVLPTAEAYRDCRASPRTIPLAA